MKNTPQSFLTKLTETVLNPVLLIDMELAGQNIRLTTFSTTLPILDTESSITYNYVSDGGLLTFSPPELSHIFDREVYKIKLADLSNEYRTLFEANPFGGNITIYMGLVDGSALPGSYDDLDKLYEGIVDATFVEVDYNSGSIEATIEASTPFGSLDKTKDRQTDKQTQRNIDSTDSCFDSIYTNSEEIALRWGKK